MGRITKREFKSLLEWRQATQKTQMEAAQQFGISQPQWSIYERGRVHPLPKLAKRLADATGVALEILLGIADDSSGESEALDRDRQIS